MPLSGSTSPVLWSDPVAPAFETSLANIVNEPGLNQIIAPTADPLLAPPVYGRWHAGRAVVTPGAANWLDELNLDPRWRSAAALGTQVIQEHQEALMASAWEQAAEIQPVNQRMRQLQLSMAVGESLHARHLLPLTEEMTLRFASPAFNRIRVASPDSDGAIAHRNDDEDVAAGSGDAARDAPHRPAARTADATHRGARVRPRAREHVGGAPQLEQRAAGRRSTAHQPGKPAAAADCGQRGQRHLELRVRRLRRKVSPCRRFRPVDPLPPAWDYPGHFRAAAAAHLSRLRPRISASLMPHITMSATVGIVREQMRPRVALANLARAIVAKGDNVLQPTAPGVTPVGTEAVMMAPSFPQPMYEALKEKSQDLLLPGLEKVEPEKVVGLRTNRAFVEAYMIGLNVEMARELLWRGFPTDQQGTYFKHFWGTDAGTATPTDIDDLRKNLGRPLGAAPRECAGGSIRVAAAKQSAATLSERDHLSHAGFDRDAAAAAGRRVSDLRRQDGARHQLRRVPDHAGSGGWIRRQSWLLRRDPGTSRPSRASASTPRSRRRSAQRRAILRSGRSRRRVCR